jgi:phenylacetate-CoA ligase
MEQSQWWPAERLENMRADRLRAMTVHAAATSPFYAERFAAAGIDPASVRSISDLAGLPILTKADIREHLHSLRSTAYGRQELVPAKTGGSTGEALHVYCDRQGVERRAGAALRSDSWSGWRLGQPIASVWGNPPRIRTWRNRLRRTLKDRVFYLDTMRIDAEAIDRFVAEWQRWRPGLLYGHAHSLFILAEALLDRAIRLPVNGIVATSMMLIEPERNVIEQVFGVPVTDRYGCEEVSLIACECEEHHGLHLNAEHAYVEFLRDDGSPCAPGEDGRIVVTELVNFGMPMIRYEVGDRGAPSDRVCTCGRSLPLMERLTGRSADFLLATDGSRVAGVSLIERTLTRHRGIKQLQIVQDQHAAAVVNVVPGEDWSEEVRIELATELREHLGQDFLIEVREVREIARERNGKYRFSICRV